MVGGKCRGGEWRINERMKNVEIFKYLGSWVWFDGREEMYFWRRCGKRPRIGWSRVNGEMDVE